MGARPLGRRVERRVGRRARGAHGPGGAGTDTAGSLRIPSALCGISAIKPTHGRVPIDGIVPLARDARPRRADGAQRGGLHALLARWQRPGSLAADAAPGVARFRRAASRAAAARRAHDRA